MRWCDPTRRGSTVSCRPPQNWLDTRDSCSQAMRSQRNPVRFTTAARATVEPSVAGPTRHPAAALMKRRERPVRVSECDNLPTVPGISVLPALDGPFIHPKGAERTKLCASLNRPAPEAVTSARADGRPTGAPWFQALLRHRSTVGPFLLGISSVSGRRLSSGHRQCPDPPEHVAEQPPGQMPFRQQEPVVPGVLH